MKITDKVAIITGAARGIGRAIAERYVREGAKVVIADINEDGAKAAGSALGPNALGLKLDITQQASIDATVATTVAHFGRLDILVNDIWGGEAFHEWKGFLEHSLDKGLRMLEGAINTHIITSRYAAPLLVDTGGGVIVEVTDGNTFAYRGTVYYDLVKTSIIRLAFSLSEELKKKNIAVIARYQDVISQGVTGGSSITVAPPML